MRLHTVITITGLIPIGCASFRAPDCPMEIRASEDCTTEAMYCPQPDAPTDMCGIVGFTCTNGVWVERNIPCSQMGTEPVCPASITELEACAQEGQYCPQPELDEQGCGQEGFLCENGEWISQITTCNPPPPPPPEPLPPSP